ncbi:DhNV_102 [Dikerogammarus haemobaphes nudivirus]|nr:DhNV_102 [Dikerogammarus haemobaphes nudivirus]
MNIQYIENNVLTIHKPNDLNIKTINVEKISDLTDDVISLIKVAENNKNYIIIFLFDDSIETFVVLQLIKNITIKLKDLNKILKTNKQ